MEKFNFRDTAFQVFRSDQNNAIQLIIYHGICEHSLRYLPFIKKLNKIGFDCTLIDHPGHGQNVLKEAFSDEFFSFYDYLEKDLELATHKISDFKATSTAKVFQRGFLKSNKHLTIKDVINYQKEFYSFLFREKIYNRTQKTMILGQSMGGLVATSLAPELNEISGCILLSPAFKGHIKPINTKSSMDKKRHKIEKAIIEKSDASFDQKSFFSTGILKPLLALNPSSDCSWAWEYISDIAEINEIFAIDPFIGRKVSLKFLHSIQNLMKKQREVKEEFPCPAFVQFGMEDKIVDPEGCSEFIGNRLTSSGHFFKLLNNFQPHEIHNSKRQNYLLNDIEEWTSKLP